MINPINEKLLDQVEDLVPKQECCDCGFALEEYEIEQGICTICEKYLIKCNEYDRQYEDNIYFGL